MKLKILLLLSFLSISSISSSYADFEDAVKSYDEKRYEEAFNEFESLAINGNADAQLRLGEMFLFGHAPKEKMGPILTYDKYDYINGYIWIEKAAKQSQIEALRQLGNNYRWGRTVQKNYVTAIEWYLKAAEQGDLESASALAYLYKGSEGVPKDYEKVIYWYTKAANGGYILNVTAESLGRIYYDGIEVPKDLSEAIGWWEWGAEGGSPGSISNLANLNFGEYMSESDKFKWMLLDVNDYNYYSQFDVARAYYLGIGTLKDYKEAFKYFNLSATLGYAPSQTYLGYMYFLGQGITKDPSLSKYWIKLAYDNPDVSEDDKALAENLWNNEELWKY